MEFRMASRAATHIQERRTANRAMADSEYDAGVAARMSERPNTRVAQVEAHGENRYEQSYYPTVAATPPRPTSRLPASGTIG
jgi:hypothetical protein